MEQIYDLIEIREDFTFNVRIDGAVFHDVFKIRLQIENDVPNSVPKKISVKELVEMSVEKRLDIKKLSCQ